MNVNHCKNYEEMSEKAAKIVFERASSAKKQFSIAISGGDSIKGLLRILGEKKPKWPHVNVFMVDERAVSVNSPESNFEQARELFFSKSPEIHAHALDLKKGAKEYSNRFMEITKGKVDLIVLGVGEDGHIASLFPNKPSLDYKEEGYLEISDSPKPPKKRFSLSVKTIQNAQSSIILFASESKKPAFKRFMDEEASYQDCPAKIIRGNKNVSVFTVFGG